MKDFWNERYDAEAYAYGTTPNVFIAEQLKQLRAGKVLIPADGEGRNAVFAAELGWEVHAFDISESGKTKAMKLAAEKGVEIRYDVIGMEEIELPIDHYDAVVLTFAHFPSAVRKGWHQKLVKALKPGGKVILEAFSKDHLKFNAVNPKAGGPKSEDQLFSTSELSDDFDGLTFHLLEAKEVYLEEGAFHVGDSAVVRMVAEK